MNSPAGSASAIGIARAQGASCDPRRRMSVSALDVSVQVAEVLALLEESEKAARPFHAVHHP